MKKIFRLLLVLFAMAFSLMPALADNSDYVTDDYGILEQEELNELNALAATAVNDYNTAIYMRILDDQVKDQDFDAFISNYYYTNDLNTNALLFLIDIGEENANYGYFTNGSHATELSNTAFGHDDEILSQLNNGDFAQAYRVLYDYAVGVLKEQKTVSDNVVYVYDEYGYLSADEVAQLNEKAKNISLEHDCGIYIRVFDDKAGSMDIEAFAEKVFLDENLGIGSEQNGAMFIINVADYRYFDICAHGTIGHGAFTDWGKGEITDTCVNYFRDGNWYKGFNKYLDMADEYLASYEQGNPVDTWIPDQPTLSPEEEEAAKRSTSFLSGGIGGLVSSILICLGLRSKNRTEHIATEARNYIPENGVKITNSHDLFLGRTESRVKIHDDSGSRSGGGGHYGGTSVSSSGFSHSSGKF